MVRTFVGIIIPEDIKRYVISIQEQLKSLPIDAKFVEPENIHVSLSFLGDMEDSELEKIKFKIDEISKSYERFEIVLGNIILLPDEKFTRVIALDVNTEALESLRKELVENVGGKSHPAHLTLARIKNINNKQKFVEDVNKIVCSDISVMVDSIDLIGSVLRRSGPVYTVLHKGHLK